MNNLFVFRFGHFFYKESQLVCLSLKDLRKISECKNPFENYKPVPLTRSLVKYLGFKYNNPIGRHSGSYILTTQYAKVRLVYNESRDLFHYTFGNSMIRFKFLNQLQDFLFSFHSVIIPQNQLKYINKVLQKDVER